LGIKPSLRIEIQTRIGTRRLGSWQITPLRSYRPAAGLGVVWSSGAGGERCWGAWQRWGPAAASAGAGAELLPGLGFPQRAAAALQNPSLRSPAWYRGAYKKLACLL